MDVKMKKQYIIPIFVPHLGCPNDCTFCNQKKIIGQSTKMTAKKAKEHARQINSVESVSLVGKFANCTGKKPEIF